MVRRTELLTKSTIQSLLREIASTRPDTVALTGLEGEPSTYADLLSQVENTATWLSSSSISHGDKVVTVVPDSPEMAALFLGVSSVAACAPLNPRYRTTDFERYLPDLNPKLVIVDSATESPIRDMARSTGIPVVELRRGSETEGALAELASGEDFSGKQRLGFIGCAEVEVLAELDFAAGADEGRPVFAAKVLSEQDFDTSAGVGRILLRVQPGAGSVKACRYDAAVIKDEEVAGAKDLGEIAEEVVTIFSGAAVKAEHPAGAADGRW